MTQGMSRGRKRKSDNGDPEIEVKKSRNGDPAVQDASPMSGPGGATMTPDQIRAMMSNTLKEIQARKEALNSLKAARAAPGGVAPGVAAPGVAMPGNISVIQPDATSSKDSRGSGTDKAKTIAALQAQIAARLNKVGIASIPAPPATVPALGDKPHLILNAEGRTVDAHGQEISLGHLEPTLKANMRMTKADDPVTTTADNLAQQEMSSKYYDPRVGGKSALRQKRAGFVFNEPGKYIREGAKMRMKAQLERLQADISTIARKTGIQSATQLAKLVPKGDAKGRCPDVEWWDNLILIQGASYENGLENIREEAITNLIEHPIQMKPMESTMPVHVPVFLTKKEMKKLRRQNRREAWKEKQDKIRIGLLSPDEPKVKMSNLMRVLGTEAVQDPTKVEAHVREQMAKRKATHEKMNADRKLTPEQRKEKTIRKIKEDTSGGVEVAVYRYLFDFVARFDDFFKFQFFSQN